MAIKSIRDLKILGLIIAYIGDLKENSVYRVSNDHHVVAVHESRAPAVHEIRSPVVHEVRAPVVHEVRAPAVHYVAPVIAAPVHHTHTIVAPVIVTDDQVVEEIVVPVEGGYAHEEVMEHNIRCHNDPTFVHGVSFADCNCEAAPVYAPNQFNEVVSEERKFTGVFPWWLLPLILLGLMLIGKSYSGCLRSLILLPKAHKN